MSRQQPLTEADILAALRDCYDPALTLNVVDLGLIQSIAIAPDAEAPGSGIRGVPSRHRVSVSLILTDDDTAAASALPALIQNRLAAFETISRTEVEIRSQPIWTPDRISPEGRIRLAAHLNSRKPSHELIQIKT
jgi:metal-sulfur cluster biosynthetic enzyme